HRSDDRSVQGNQSIGIRCLRDTVRRFLGYGIVRAALSRQRQSARANLAREAAAIQSDAQPHGPAPRVLGPNRGWAGLGKQESPTRPDARKEKTDDGGVPEPRWPSQT